MSDAPARNPCVVSAVASHDSLAIRFYDLTSVSFRDLPLLYDIIECFK